MVPRVAGRRRYRSVTHFHFLSVRCQCAVVNGQHPPFKEKSQKDKPVGSHSCEGLGEVDLTETESGGGCLAEGGVGRVFPGTESLGGWAILEGTWWLPHSACPATAELCPWTSADGQCFVYFTIFKNKIILKENILPVRCGRVVEC